MSGNSSLCPSGHRLFGAAAHKSSECNDDGDDNDDDDDDNDRRGSGVSQSCRRFELLYLLNGFYRTVKKEENYSFFSCRGGGGFKESKIQY